MNKQEKYYNYVVDKLMDLIRIDMDDKIISFPWVIEDAIQYYNEPHTEFPFYRHTVMEFEPYKPSTPSEPVYGDYTDMDYFPDYVQSKFGVRESEVMKIWRILTSKLFDMTEIDTGDDKMVKMFKEYKDLNM